MPVPSSTPFHPVAIIGGGPVGLSASILLSLRGIPHVLFERHAGTSIHPKACGINQRTTEVFRDMGIYDAVRAIACPDDIKGRTAWYTSLGTDDIEGGKTTDLVDGREIWSRDAWGCGVYAEEYEKLSPARYEILPQIRLEPLLLRRAKELNLEGLKFGHEVVDLEERRDHVVLSVLERKTGTTKEVFARFVIAADGGRNITDRLGVTWLGERNILHMVSAHFKADLRERHPDPRNFMTWFSHPAASGSIKTGYLYQIGPWPFDSPEAKAGEEWIFACALLPNDPVSFDGDAMVQRLRNTLKLGDLSIEIISLSHWHVNALSAETYRKGRVFLVGDAAHRIPPWGALGMNTGIQDVQNLVWKIQLALNDEKLYDALLQSYDTERRPVGRRVGQSSLYNLQRHGLVMDAALGLGTDKSPEENKRNIIPLFDESHPEHASKRKAVEVASKILDLEFKAPGIEVGWFYPGIGEAEEADHAAHLLPDGDLNFEFAIPSTVPGHNVPHVWIYRDGEKKAIRDLRPLDKLLLLANANPGWGNLKSELVEVEVVNTTGNTWVEPTGYWERLLAGQEAVLVRPDGIISWRGKWHVSLPQLWHQIVRKSLYVV